METVDAGQLVALGHCSPACLLALEAGGKCRCRCEGRYHGTLAGEPIELLLDAHPRCGSPKTSWFERYCHYNPVHLDQACPVVRSVEQFNKVWRARKSAGVVFAVAAHRARFSWAAVTDAFTAKDDYHPDMIDVGRQLVEVVLVAKSNRNAIGEVGPDRLGVGGLRSPQDAQVLGSALSDLWRGDTTAALGLYRALREDVEREASRRPVSAAWLAANGRAR